MKIRVFKAFVNGNLIPVTPKDVTEWPSRSEVLQRIEATPEYRAVCDVGLPEGENLEQTLNYMLERFETQLVFEWIEHHIHGCLSMYNLDDDSGRPGLVNTFIIESRGNLSGLHPQYKAPVDVFKQYYLTLQNKFVNSLYNEKKVYSPEELEVLVPVIESEYYDRDKVFEEYNKWINRLKSPRTRARVEAEINSFVSL